MSLENEIAILEQVTNDLLDAVNTNKTKLDTAVTDAETAVSTATTQVNLVTAEKLSAQIARDEAESHKDLAYGYSQSAASAVAYQDLTAIAQTKAETAVDVFVYDTSKDSDGGAWRKRTQGTSWYNETLNTATRGSRKEFPAVAVLVLEANKLTVYDGDDPSLPMWMVFNGGSTSYFKPTSGARSVFALNGNVFISVNASFTGSGWFNFITDSSIASILQSTIVYRVTLPVSGRNNTDIANRIIVSDSPYQLVNSNANDVAMTVLPDAPVDPDTGLPIPTIAVATDGGVSVIKDDGSVFDITSTENSGSSNVIFLDNNKIMFTFWNNYNSYVYNIPDEDIAHGGQSGSGNSLEAYHSYYYTAPDLQLAPVYYTGIENVVSMKSDLAFDIILRPPYSDYCLVLLNRVPENPSTGMLSYVNTKYNTGWMNGDIKLATLSDTDDTDLVDTELVTNGTFDTDVSSYIEYTPATFSLTYENGVARVTFIQDATSGYSIGQQIPTVVGKTYRVRADLISSDAGYKSRLYTNSTPIYLDGSGSFDGYFVATSTSTRVRFFHSATLMEAGQYFELDNISVRPAETDRSVNNNGLQVFGTITKEPVATGADLMAYSGFSATNYLEQSYNSDLDFGTGDFCVMGWVKTTSAVSQQNIFFRGDESASGSWMALQTFSGYPRIFTVVGNTKSTGSISMINNGAWHFVCGVRRNGTLEMFVNGSLSASVSEGARDLTNTSALSRTGRSVSGSVNQWGGSLALLRISATAPTAEQIEKIYNDEKVLFQENAQATLYGTSDAVTALAYDEDTDLLHVGTSSGRSVFQGLERVDNTTDAVGTAISAVNGLVVEE